MGGLIAVTDAQNVADTKMQSKVKAILETKLEDILIWNDKRLRFSWRSIYNFIPQRSIDVRQSFASLGSLFLSLCMNAWIFFNESSLDQSLIPPAIAGSAFMIADMDWQNIAFSVKHHIGMFDNFYDNGFENSPFQAN